MELRVPGVKSHLIPNPHYCDDVENDVLFPGDGECLMSIAGNIEHHVCMF